MTAKSVKERAAAFRAAAQTAFKDHLTRIEVKEFAGEGEPGVVYGKPPTLAQRSSILSRAGENIHEQALYTVIELALDETGARLFTIEDLQFLRTQVSADLIEWLAAHLNAGQSYAAVKKN
jgi:hypothetical protein